MLNLSDDLVATKDVHQGHITFGGCTVFVEFEVPASPRLRASIEPREPNCALVLFNNNPRNKNIIKYFIFY